MAEQDVLGDAGEGRALGIDAAPMQVLFEQDLGRVVAHLRTGHQQRVP